MNTYTCLVFNCNHGSNAPRTESPGQTAKAGLNDARRSSGCIAFGIVRGIALIILDLSAVEMAVESVLRSGMKGMGGGRKVALCQSHWSETLERDCGLSFWRLSCVGSGKAEFSKLSSI